MNAMKSIVTGVLSLAAGAGEVRDLGAAGGGWEATESFNVRDPYVLPFPEEGVYRLYVASRHWQGGDGVDVRVSRDLKTWSPPKPALRLPESLKKQVLAYWAPEVHAYRGRYYLFVTLTFSGRRRGTWIFRSECPEGSFATIVERAVTPEKWMCLDGTLWVEDGKPYIVFCHEWEQVGNGRMMLAPLKEDLSGLAGEPQELFKATDYSTKPLVLDEQARHRDRVTDGPFIYRSPESGKLFMIWSNVITGNGYVDILCESASGKVQGPWGHHKILFERDGGHGMLFRTLDGQLTLTLHQPNNSPLERMRFFPVRDDGQTLRLETLENLGTAFGTMLRGMKIDEKARGLVGCFCYNFTSPENQVIHAGTKVVLPTIPQQ